MSVIHPLRENLLAMAHVSKLIYSYGNDWTVTNYIKLVDIDNVNISIPEKEILKKFNLIILKVNYYIILVIDLIYNVVLFFHIPKNVLLLFLGVLNQNMTGIMILIYLKYYLIMIFMYIPDFIKF